MKQPRQRLRASEFDTTDAAVQDRLTKLYDRLKHNRNTYCIESKPFTVTNVSTWGKQYLSLEENQEYTFSGIRATDRFGVLGRSFFFPQAVQPLEDSQSRRYVEVKGYGADGKEICTWPHCEGDILFGMFYHNAKKEYDILTAAAENGLRVPLPLLLGKISKETWWNSALAVIDKIKDDEEFSIEEIRNYENFSMEELEEKLKKALGYWPVAKDPIGSFKQPYLPGIVLRAARSPIRLGDPSDIYTENERNIWIARTCGKTFWDLLDIGYFHDTPGTGNFTTEAELTDMADCHDLRNVDLGRLIANREKLTGLEFWEDILSSRYTGNLSPFFIEGMLGRQASVTGAARILKEKVRSLTKF